VKIKPGEWQELTMGQRMMILIRVHEEQAPKRKALSMALENGLN
jgi:hypothetical protein